VPEFSGQGNMLCFFRNRQNEPWLDWRKSRKYFAYSFKFLAAISRFFKTLFHKNPFRRSTHGFELSALVKEAGWTASIISKTCSYDQATSIRAKSLPNIQALGQKSSSAYRDRTFTSSFSPLFPVCFRMISWELQKDIGPARRVDLTLFIHSRQIPSVHLWAWPMIDYIRVVQEELFSTKW